MEIIRRRCRLSQPYAGAFLKKDDKYVFKANGYPLHMLFECPCSLSIIGLSSSRNFLVSSVLSIGLPP